MLSGISGYSLPYIGQYGQPALELNSTPLSPLTGSTNVIVPLGSNTLQMFW